jgi:xylulokinase
MKKTYILAIDLGVSLVKIGIYDASGNCTLLVTERSPAEYPQPDVFVQSGDEYFMIVIRLIKSLMEKPHIRPANIEAIVFSGAMGGAIGIDNGWNALTPWSTVIDNRSCPYAIDMMNTAGDEIRTLSGTNFPSYTPKILWWKTEYPDVYGKISKFMFLNGFIAGKMGNLTSENAFVDRTYLQMTGIADLERNEWSDRLCDKFGIDKNKIPSIVQPNTIIGKLSKKIAQKCDLLDGIPLIAGAGDKPAGYLGAGMATPGLLIDEAASFAAFSLCTDRYKPDLKHRTLENIPSPISGHYYPTIYLIGSGTTQTWFKNTFGDEEKRIAAESGKSDYDILDDKAKDVPPGSDGLLASGL